MKKFVFLAFLLFATIQSTAQSVGGSVMLGFPQGEFKQKVDNIGYGIQLQGTLTAPTQQNPIAFGLDLGYLVYGNETYYRPDIDANINRTNNILTFHFLLQLSPFSGNIRPYIETIFGGAYLFTTTKIESQYSGDDYFQTTNFDSFAWNYGAGAGLLIKINEDIGGISGLFLDIKARFLYGTETEYLQEGSITFHNGTTFYNVNKSKTDLFSIHVGVVAYF